MGKENDGFIDASSIFDSPSDVKPLTPTEKRHLAARARADSSLRQRYDLVPTPQPSVSPLAKQEGRQYHSAAGRSAIIAEQIYHGSKE